MQQIALFSFSKEWILPDTQMKRRLWPMGIGVVYVLVNYLLGGLTTDHFVFASLSVLDAYNENTRKFLKYFFPFLLTGAIYDSMRYYYWWGITGHIHVKEHYEFDKLLFGIKENSRLLSLPEYFNVHTSKALDLLCGFAYLVFVAEYLAAAFGLFFKKKFELLRTFGFAFLIVNLIGFVTYYIYPAAPPWYINLYGLGEARLDVQSNAAAAARFDQILGTHFFDQIYGRGIDVYGSIPSLHVAYPLLVTWIVWKEWRLFFLPALAFYFLMCFSAVYLQHHHVIDIILGSFYALITVPIATYLVERSDKRSELVVTSESELAQGAEA